MPALPPEAQNLLDMGFSRFMVGHAMQRGNNNVEEALGLLLDPAFEASLPPPPPQAQAQPPPPLAPPPPTVVFPVGGATPVWATPGTGFHGVAGYQPRAPAPAYRPQYEMD